MLVIVFAIVVLALAGSTCSRHDHEPIQTTVDRCIQHVYESVPLAALVGLQPYTVCVDHVVYSLRMTTVRRTPVVHAYPCVGQAAALCGVLTYLCRKHSS